MSASFPSQLSSDQKAQKKSIKQVCPLQRLYGFLHGVTLFMSCFLHLDAQLQQKKALLNKHETLGVPFTSQSSSRNKTRVQDNFLFRNKWNRSDAIITCGCFCAAQKHLKRKEGEYICKGCFSCSVQSLQENH